MEYHIKQVSFVSENFRFFNEITIFLTFLREFVSWSSSEFCHQSLNCIGSLDIFDIEAYRPKNKQKNENNENKGSTSDRSIIKINTVLEIQKLNKI